MSCKFICDGCGKEANGRIGDLIKAWFAPRDWYERSDDDGIQTACSRACIETVAKKTGKTSAVLPV